jgi:hypothetical protein
LSSFLSERMTLVPRIAELLKKEGAEDMVLVVGGTIPNDDIPELTRLGVAEMFTPGAPVQGIIDYISRQCQPEAAWPDSVGLVGAATVRASRGSSRKREKPRKSRLFRERLKGFEPSTFCMASRACGPDSGRISLQTARFPSPMRREGFPALPGDHGCLGTEWVPDLGLVAATREPRRAAAARDPA